VLMGNSHEKTCIPSAEYEVESQESENGDSPAVSSASDSCLFSVLFPPIENSYILWTKDKYQICRLPSNFRILKLILQFEERLWEFRKILQREPNYLALLPQELFAEVIAVHFSRVCVCVCAECLR
jgi:hypothetical protein